MACSRVNFTFTFMWRLSSSSGVSGWTKKDVKYKIHKFLERIHIQKKHHESEISGKKITGNVMEQL